MSKSNLLIILLAPILIICSSCTKNSEVNVNDNQEKKNNDMKLSEYQTVEEDTEITMQLITNSPSISDKNMEICIINQSNDTINYGEIYELDVYQNEKWYVVTEKDDAEYTWALTEYSLNSLQKGKQIIDLGRWNINKGYYRLLKIINDGKVISLEFDLTE